MSNTQVAATILQQLGGGRFAVMTGAREFLAGENSLMFRLPQNASRRVRKVRITLDASDTYTMEFIGRMPGHRDLLCVLKTVPGVYCDQLQSIFTAETGLYTKL